MVSIHSLNHFESVFYRVVSYSIFKEDHIKQRYCIHVLHIHIFGLGKNCNYLIGDHDNSLAHHQRNHEMKYKKIV